MKSKSLPVLLALVVGGIIIWWVMGRPAGSNSPGQTSTCPVPARQSPHPQDSGKNLPLHQPRLTAAARQLLDADPAKAVAAHPQNLDLLVAWAARDPDAAMAWIEGHPMAWKDEDGGEISQSRANLLGAIAAGILIRDGAGAMTDFLAKHQQDPELPPKNQGELLKYAFFNLGREDSIEAALPLLHGEDASDLAGMMVLGVGNTRAMTRAIDYLDTKGVKVEVDYWAFQNSIDGDPRYWADWAQQRDSDLLVEIVHGWNRDHPAEARQWLNERLPADDPRRKEIEELLQL